jgi:hypothetical protein
MRELFDTLVLVPKDVSDAEIAEAFELIAEKLGWHARVRCRPQKPPRPAKSNEPTESPAISAVDTRDRLQKLEDLVETQAEDLEQTIRLLATLAAACRNAPVERTARGLVQRSPE